MKKIKKLLFNNLKEFFSNKGFILSSQDEWFYRRINPDFIQIYDFLFYDSFDLKRREKAIRIEPAIWIISERVENIYAQITNRKFDKLTDLRTIGNTLANIIANQDGLYKKRNNELDIYILNDEDLNKELNKFIILFDKYVEPFFDKYSNYSALDELLNVDYKKHFVYKPDNYGRVLKGIILANLLKRDDLNKLIGQQSKIFIEAPDAYKKEYDNLIKLITP